MLDPALFETIFRRAPIGAYLLTPTPEARVLAVNDAFLANAGRARAEMLGRSLFEVFPEDPDDPGDGGESALRESILRAIGTGEPDALSAQRYPIRVQRADGTWEYEERFWDVVNTPIPDGRGGLACVLHTTSEVTSQVVARRALHRSERQSRLAAAQADAERRRLQAVVDAVPVGMVLSDARGRIVLTNQSHRELWGDAHPSPGSVADFKDWKGRWWDGSERHGQPVQPEEWPTARALGGDPAPHAIVEIAPFCGSRGHRIVLVSGAPVRDAQGEIVGAVVAQLDITDRVAAEERLREAGRRKDEFLAMLAHELRNPLAPIGAAADLLALGSADTQRAQEAGAVIARQVRHMTGLVDDLLDVSRVTRGLIRLTMQEVDLRDVLAEALEQTRPLLQARGHRVAVRTPPQPARVRGDRKRLVQVVVNLLSNAAKYTPDRGDIDVSIALAGHRVTLEVADTGVGMSPGFVEHAFELFAQSERTADRSQGGLGIGLALVKRLTEVHGGRVSARSQGLGRGSRFTLDLPRLEDATAAATTTTVAGGAVGDDRIDAGAPADGVVTTRPYDITNVAHVDGVSDVNEVSRVDEVACVAIEEADTLHARDQRDDLAATWAHHPADAADAADKPDPPDEPVPLLPGRGRHPLHALKVLVLDDNRDAAEMLGVLLEAAGHCVAVEHDPRQALQHASQDPPEACLIDIGLPEMDGVEVARRLRAQPATAAATLVAITGYGQEQHRAAAMQAGFDHYFVKPVDGRGLMALLGDVAASRA